MVFLNNLQFLNKLGIFVFWVGLIFIGIGAILQIKREIKQTKDHPSFLKRWLPISLIVVGVIFQVAEKLINKKIDAIREKERISLQTTLNKQDEKLKQIEREVKNRLIPDDKTLLLVKELSVYKGERIEITSVWGDQEAFSFADQLKTIFEKAGWEVYGVNQATYAAPMKGLIIKINNKTNKDRAQELFLIFRSIGFHSTGITGEEQEKDLGIIVGAK